MQAKSWRGGEDGSAPRFTDRGHRWFARWVRVLCRLRLADQADTSDADALVDALVGWYREHWKRYVRYEPADCYRGEHFSAGQWLLLRDTFAADFAGARAECERRLEARRPPIPPGPIDVDAALAALTAPPTRPVEETAAYKLVNAGAKNRYWETARKIERRKVCRGCAEWFTAKPITAESCAECRATRKLKAAGRPSRPREEQAESSRPGVER